MQVSENDHGRVRTNGIQVMADMTLGAALANISAACMTKRLRGMPGLITYGLAKMNLSATSLMNGQIT